MTRVPAVVVLLGLLAPISSASAAERPWTEVSSDHFIIRAEAGEKPARSTLWAFEQLRTAMKTIWPWVGVDLDRPVMVLLVKDEGGMKMLAPQYWEERGSVHPTGVFVGGVDRHYIALRADAQFDDRQGINPYRNAYFAYVTLVLQNGLKVPLPLWFQRGIAEVMSNTIVRDKYLELGRVLPGHLQRLRSSSRMDLATLVSLDRQTLGNDAERTASFDAEAWAFVHYLLFSHQGMYLPKMSQFMSTLVEGKSAPQAFELAFGSVNDIGNGFAQYINGTLFNYSRVDADLKISADGFAMRQLSLADTVATRGGFHAAMRRLTEARADVAAARAYELSASSFDVEGIVLDADGKGPEARAAFLRAVDLGSTNFWSYYRAATLTSPADNAQRPHISELLERAVALAPRYAFARARLADMKLAAGAPDAAVPLAQRAVELDPGIVSHRLTFARALWAAGRKREALGQAREALAMSRSDAERQASQRLVDTYASAQ